MAEENKAENLSPAMAGATRSAEAACALIPKTKRGTRRRFPTEDKVRIVIERVRGEISGAELCRREGIHPTDLLQVAEGLQRAVMARRMRWVRSSLLSSLAFGPAVANAGRSGKNLKGRGIVQSVTCSDGAPEKLTV